MHIHYDLNRALLHFLDHDKFKSKDDFIQNYKNLSSFNENEVQVTILFFFPSIGFSIEHFPLHLSFLWPMILELLDFV